MSSSLLHFGEFKPILCLVSFILVGFNQLDWHVHILHDFFKLSSWFKILDVFHVALKLFV